ncbi:anti-sigma factor [Bradyrhizobium sp. AUGA SZCCT0222]|uniref:anti-sigma factor n=1 Tax=Bradyrhizobium sp. AUGA SZCCT0222 TaxID=2807668 RepID=UPI001BA5A77D|nr:anti-sigma factor [Bradyrhizobium sp. AUGA SZCCT0222]MBR1272842.1 anti-sigma factor [Bradyrhizobium sp. AUGA SZCCT0222]
MAYSEDHIALAAEYALGTLDADERAQVETMMAVDTEFTAVVQAWEYRLGVLNQMVGSVEPRPIVWENIQRAIGHAGPQVPLALPEAAPPPPSIVPVFVEQAPVADGSAAGPSAADNFARNSLDNSNVVQLSGRVKRWRNLASFATAAAAALIAMLGLQVYSPDSLPNALRPKIRTQLVEVKTPPLPAPPSAQYVAILQANGGSPAFILTVDAATKNFTVRKVGATAEAGKSFELWLVSDKLPQPRSLGVIGGSEFTARNVLASYDAGTINAATYAVTVEQAGGSRDGKPNLPPVFAGKLIETVPAGPAR